MFCSSRLANIHFSLSCLDSTFFIQVFQHLKFIESFFLSQRFFRGSLIWLPKSESSMLTVSAANLMSSYLMLKEVCSLILFLRHKHSSARAFSLHSFNLLLSNLYYIYIYLPASAAQPKETNVLTKQNKTKQNKKKIRDTCSAF